MRLLQIFPPVQFCANNILHIVPGPTIPVFALAKTMDGPGGGDNRWPRPEPGSGSWHWSFELITPNLLQGDFQSTFSKWGASMK
jgi:hypothetical protein